MHDRAMMWADFCKTSLALTVSVVWACMFIAQDASGMALDLDPLIHKQFSTRPPTPPKIYDPQAGPFVVRLDGEEHVREDQYGVVANAVRNWSGNKLQSFTICFHSTRDKIDWNSAYGALETVARELKSQGAAVVVMPNGSLCDTSLPKVTFEGSYVEIMGVIRL